MVFDPYEIGSQDEPENLENVLSDIRHTLAQSPDDELAKEWERQVLAVLGRKE